MNDICANIERTIVNINDIISLLSKFSLGNIHSQSSSASSSHNLVINKELSQNSLILDNISDKTLNTMDLLMKTSRISNNLKYREKRTIDLIQGNRNS